MQNRDGGWASFDRDNDKAVLTQVPFADHNAMIDPSSADITGRVLECLSYFPGFGPGHPVVARALRFLRARPEPRGRLVRPLGRQLHLRHLAGAARAGLRRRGHDGAVRAPRRRAGCSRTRTATAAGARASRSYNDPEQAGRGASTPSQTAWAVMGLVAAGEERSTAVRNGVRHLLERQDAGGHLGGDGRGRAPAFPRSSISGYHLYRHTFPLMALGQYRRAAAGSEPR